MFLHLSKTVANLREEDNNNNKKILKSLLHYKRFPAENVRSGGGVQREETRSGSLGKAGRMLCHQLTEETVWMTVGCPRLLDPDATGLFGRLDV